MSKPYTGSGEHDFTKWLKQELVEDGAVMVPMVAGHMTSGWPDRLVYHRLWHGLLEIKARAGRLRADQRANLRRLRERRPGHAFVVREPGVIEDEAGNVCGTFTSGAELIALLVQLTEETACK